MSSINFIKVKQKTPSHSIPSQNGTEEEVIIEDRYDDLYINIYKIIAIQPMDTEGSELTCVIHMQDGSDILVAQSAEDLIEKMWR